MAGGGGGGDAADESIHEAARRGDVEAVRARLAADLGTANERDRLSRTPLHLAAWAGQEEVVRLLCDVGAEVGAAAMDDMAALHFACQKGHTGAARALVSAGARVDARNRKGMTPLHFAAQAQNADLARLLVKKGASVAAENKAGKVPADLARDASFRSVLVDAELERTARRVKGRKEAQASGIGEESELGGGTDERGEGAEEKVDFDVPAPPLVRTQEEILDEKSPPQEVGSCVPEPAPMQQSVEAINGNGLPGDMEQKSADAIAGSKRGADAERSALTEAKRKRTMLRLSFGDDDEDEIDDG